jgi:hypothetical protein
MVNEDIVTGLRNAINRGESLDYAMNVMINSGYNAQEVAEASQYVSRGVINTLQPKTNIFVAPSQEQKLTPLAQQNESNVPLFAAKPPPSLTPEQRSLAEPGVQQIEEPTVATIYPEIKKSKKSYALEIILFIILILLIGLLAATIIYREEIIKILSG